MYTSFIPAGVLCLLISLGAPSTASAFCTGDPGWSSYGITLQVVGQTTVTMTVRAKVDHLLSHPSCNGIVASKATLLGGAGVNCTDTQGVAHFDATNTEVIFSTQCPDLPCGQTFFAGGEHWWGYEPVDSLFSQSVNGHFYDCPTPEETCEDAEGSWVCDPVCDCVYVNCPLIADLSKNGVALTNGPAGVDFDLRPDGVMERLAWTRGGIRDDAFLVLDRNGNGRIDDGRELFSNYAPRERALPPNGFSALSAFDQPDYGGNNDGLISSSDAVFKWLQLWVDLNHDGMSQRHELSPLSASVSTVSLVYRESRRRDQFGNLFRYFSEMILRQPRTSSLMYDIFLVN